MHLMGEFDLITRHFRRPLPASASHIALGVGDDAALLRPAPGMALAISCDMLVAGRHFFADTDACGLGHKALAVNLSDLAATGARPLGCTLALALPAADDAWLAAFSRGLLALAEAHACPLIGGDTTRGPLNLCITVLGEVPHGQALLRSGAQAGDDVWISGTLGGARLALHALQGRAGLPDLPAPLLAAARQRLERPTPRLALGLALRGIATACMDLSDGLAGDLPHILAASGRPDAPLAATLNEAALLALTAPWAAPGLDEQARLMLALAGGDDYELLFTAPPGARAAVQAAARRAATAITRAGQITCATPQTPPLLLQTPTGALRPLPAGVAGFDHFGGDDGNQEMGQKMG